MECYKYFDCQNDSHADCSICVENSDNDIEDLQKAGNSYLPIKKFVKCQWCNTNQSIKQCDISIEGNIYCQYCGQWTGENINLL